MADSLLRRVIRPRASREGAERSLEALAAAVKQLAAAQHKQAVRSERRERVLPAQ